MKKNDPYVLVDTKQKLVIDRIQQLPECWRNISGLPGYSDEELCELTWAGWDSLGWINVRTGNLNNFVSTPENFEMNKNQLKQCISEKRKEKEIKFFDYKGIQVEPSQELKNNLFLLSRQAEKNTAKLYSIKFANKYHNLLGREILELCDIIIENTIKWNNWESTIYNQIDSCQTLSELSNINYDL